MELGEKVLCNETGCVTGQDTGRVIAKFSHVAEGLAFEDYINSIEENILKFFAYDCEGDGFTSFDTEPERNLFVEKAILDYLSDGWEEGVESIVAGVITHKVKKANIQHRRDQFIDSEGCDGEGAWWDSNENYKCNYELVQISNEEE